MATQITGTTQLQAINIMLSEIGEAPVNSISGTNNVDVAVALNILNESAMAVQSQGWNFNSEYDVTYALDINGYLVLPTNVLQADANNDNRFRNLVIRNGKMYDLDNHTDIFTATVPLDIVTVELFEQLPEYARHYITAKAATRFSARFIGDDTLTKLTSDEAQAFTAFKQADGKSEDNNLLTSDANLHSIIHRPRRRSR